MEKEKVDTILKNANEILEKRGEKYFIKNLTINGTKSTVGEATVNGEEVIIDGGKK